MNYYSLLKTGIERFSYLLYTPLNRMAMVLHGVHAGKELRVRGIISFHNIRGMVDIGRHFTCNSSGWANPIGCAQKTYIQVLNEGKLSIGDYVAVSNVAITCAKRVEIGNHVFLGAGVKIFDTDFHPLEPELRYGPKKSREGIRTKPVTIQDGVFVGADSIILKGTNIGKDSIIGAGSVVSGNIPSNEIWAGNPARFIRKLREEECSCQILI